MAYLLIFNQIQRPILGIENPVEVLRGEWQIIEYSIFQISGFFPKAINSLSMIRFFCISFQDIIQACVKINDFIVQNPFVGIVENISIHRNLCGGIFIQNDVLPDKIAHFRITPVG